MRYVCESVRQCDRRSKCGRSIQMMVWLLLLCLVTLVDCETTPPTNTTTTGDGLGECPISSINEHFLARTCTKLESMKVIGQFARWSTRMSCIGSPTESFDIIQTSSIIYARTVKTFVSKLCPFDPAHYQACGASGYSTDRNIELFRTPPACGVLCFDPVVDLYQLHDSLQECPSARVQVRYTISTVGGGEVDDAQQYQKKMQNKKRLLL